jgi:hypothetical protein
MRASLGEDPHSPPKIKIHRKMAKKPNNNQNSKVRQISNIFKLSIKYFYCWEIFT